MVSVLDYVKKYATEAATNEQIRQATNEGVSCTNGADKSDDSESSLSDFSEDEAQDMELWPPKWHIYIIYTTIYSQRLADSLLWCL